MLLRKGDDDSTFKQGLVNFVSAEKIRFSELRQYVSGFSEFTELGRSFKSFGQRKYEEARKLIAIDVQVAEGSDRHILWSLRNILELRPQVKFGEIQRQSLDLFGKFRFRTALDSLNDIIADPTLKRELVRMEIEDNCASPHVTRLGEHGESRLVDYLLSDSDNDRLFALEQFDYLHSHTVKIYDSAYSAIRVAAKKTQDKKVRRKLLLLQRQIERTNPSAVLPAVARQADAKIKGGSNPINSFNALVHKWKLSQEDSCILGLNTAHRLLEEGDLSVARQILGESIRYAGNNPLFLAWISQELGDTVRAAHFLFDLTESHASKSMSHLIDRFYNTEGACRLLFQSDSRIWFKDRSYAVGGNTIVG